MVINAEETPLVNILLYETDLRDAINEISIQTGINIICDQTVGGIVTANIIDMPLEEALNMILVSGGYTYRKINNYYLVGLADPKNITFSELSVLEVVELNNILVKDVFSLLPPFLSAYVKGDADKNILTINAAPKDIIRIKEFISKIDQPRKQVEIRILITEVDKKSIEESGINFLEFNPEKNPMERFAFDGVRNSLEIETDLYGRLLSRLKLLEEEHKASIEADPRILLSDGGKARLFIGEEQVLLIENKEGNSTRTEEIKVGIGLEVSARIIGKDKVYLELAPVLSHFIDEARPDLLVKESSLASSIYVEDGQTVCLAGMTLNNDSEYVRKVPVLGNIPLIRWLFRNENKEENSKELLVFVTPFIK
jgi:type IV pilus assembly protein PilQ